MKIIDDIDILLGNAALDANPVESILLFWAKYSRDLKDVTLLLSSDSSGMELPLKTQQWGDLTGSLISPYHGEKLTVFSNEVLSEMGSSGEAVIAFDHDIMLDSNTANYLCGFVNNTENEFALDFAEGLHRFGYKKFNWNIALYIEEAGRLMNADGPTREKIWQVTLASEKLADMDEYYFLKEKKFRSKSPQRAYHQDAMTVLNSYLRENDGTLANMNQLAYGALLRATYLKLTRPKREQAEKNLIHLAEWMHFGAGAWMPFLARLSFSLFMNHKNSSFFFRKIQKGGKNILHNLKNMAWDIAFWTMLQRRCGMEGRKGAFMLPYLLTYDKGLQDVARLMQMRACAIAPQKPPMIYHNFDPETEIYPILLKADSPCMNMEGRSWRANKRLKFQEDFPAEIEKLETDLINLAK